MKNDIQIPCNIEDSVIPWIGKTSKMMGIRLKETFTLKNINLTKEQFILLKQSDLSKRAIPYIAPKGART